MVVFEADYDEIKLKFDFDVVSDYDVVSVTSSPLRHQNNVTKIFQFGPLSIKISGCASGLGLII